MGLLDDIGGFVGEVTGFGGSGDPRTHNIGDVAFEDYFNKALADLQSVGDSSAGNRAAIESAMKGMLGDLDNNMAGRKKNFEEDMARSFGANVQNRARAAGGTGNMAQVMNPSGASMDAEARARARGFTDLYSQGVNDLGSLQGMQGNLFNQDLNKQGAISNLRMNRANTRLGIGMQNAENDFNAEQAGRQRRLGTLSGIAKSVPFL